MLPTFRRFKPGPLNAETAQQLNKLVEMVSKFARMSSVQPLNIDQGHYVISFNHPLPHVVEVSSTNTVDGRYPGTLQDFDAIANTYTDGVDVWVVDPNGEALSAQRYLAVNMSAANGRDVWVTVGGVGGTLQEINTLTETTGGNGGDFVALYNTTGSNTQKISVTNFTQVTLNEIDQLSTDNTVDVNNGYLTWWDPGTNTAVKITPCEFAKDIKSCVLDEIDQLADIGAGGINTTQDLLPILDYSDSNTAKYTTVDDFADTVGDYLAVAGNNPGWVKVTLDYTDFASASDQDVYTLPAGYLLHAVVMHATTAFSGGAISSYDIVCGRGGPVGGEYITSSDVTSVGDTTFYKWPEGTNTGTEEFPYLFSFGSSVAIRAEASSNASLSDATQGSVDFYLLVSELP